MATSFTLLPIVIGSASLVVFIIVEAYVARLPMVPVQVLVHPPTLFGCLSTLASMTARWTVLFYAPIWGIAVLGYHPASAGATLIPTSFGFSVGGLVVGAAFVRHGGGYYWCVCSVWTSFFPALLPSDLIYRNPNPCYFGTARLPADGKSIVGSALSP